jgi:hypothetical protein
MMVRAQIWGGRRAEGREFGKILTFVQKKQM